MPSNPSFPPPSDDTPRGNNPPSRNEREHRQQLWADARESAMDEAPDDSDAYPCPYCDRSFATKPGLIGHKAHCEEMPR